MEETNSIRLHIMYGDDVISVEIAVEDPGRNGSWPRPIKRLKRVARSLTTMDFLYDALWERISSGEVEGVVGSFTMKLRLGNLHQISERSPSWQEDWSCWQRYEVVKRWVAIRWLSSSILWEDILAKAIQRVRQLRFGSSWRIDDLLSASPRRKSPYFHVAFFFETKASTTRA